MSGSTQPAAQYHRQYSARKTYTRLSAAQKAALVSDIAEHQRVRRSLPLADALREIRARELGYDDIAERHDVDRDHVARTAQRHGLAKRRHDPYPAVAVKTSIDLPDARLWFPLKPALDA